MAEIICSICGDKISTFEGERIKNGILCPKCIFELGYNPKEKYESNIISNLSAMQIRELLKIKKSEKMQFQTNVTRYEKVYFDDLQKLIYYDGGLLNRQHAKYASIFDAKLIDDSVSSNKISIGNAIIGGAIAGPAGLILGGLGGGKANKICTTLQVEIDVLNKEPITVKLINSRTKTNGFVYKQKIETARKIVSKLKQILLKSQQSQGRIDSVSADKSVADEISKYHKLLKDGAITQEEFVALKQKIIGM